MRVMFDSMVIVNAYHSKKIAAANPDNELLERCRRVIETTDTIRVCAVAWLEIKRRAKGSAEIEKLDQIETRMFVDPVDVAIVSFAADLQRKRIAKWATDVCRRCGNSLANHPCKSCKLNLADKTRFNDYIIAAAAHVRREVSILYTLDTAIHSMRSDLRPDLDVLEPPNAYGPLFEHAAPPQLGAPKSMTET